MPFSHHSHSGEFCGHATGTLEEMIQSAISKNMLGYALTEHMPRDVEDFYPEEVRQRKLPHWGIVKLRNQSF
jgi:histidinol-phosphatase (PHP family)